MIETNKSERLVHHHVYNPAQSIFKTSANERASSTAIYCELESCPLLAKGCCTLRRPLFPDHCPYGRISQNTGPTKRARKYFHWIDEQRKKGEGVGELGIPPRKLAFIGQYVYLPYAHMDMCTSVEFLRHSSGRPFCKREDWTIEFVLMLICFRPQALFGGEILSYQQEQVPLFLQHIRELDPEMWEQLIRERPELDTQPNYIGRKARLKTLKAPISLPAKDHRYPVCWRWDGEKLTTTSHDVYRSTWGGINLESLELSAIPADDAVVEIKDNSWVTEGTELVD